jgi:LysM repeat protein
LGVPDRTIRSISHDHTFQAGSEGGTTMDQKNRVARSMLATVPLLIAGSLALSLVSAPSAEAAPVRKAAKNKSFTGVFGAHRAAKAPAATPAVVPQVAPSTYRVQPGDTVSSVAVRYGLPTASVLALNGLGWKSLIYPGQVLRLSKAVTPPAAVVAAVKKYTISTGDTISAIARRFGVTPTAVLAANDLSSSSIIFPGASLTIPRANSSSDDTLDATTVSSVRPIASAPTVTKYTIATGDTMTSIATKFSVSVDALLQVNDMDAASLIYAGRVITIPTLSMYVTGHGVVTLLTTEMERNARTIVSVGRALGVSDRGIVIALATAMQESALRNVDYGHLDSVGLFQQRPSIGWGSTTRLLDAKYASRLFFGGPQSPNRAVVRGLLDVPGWQKMSVTEAAQAVQVSAFPQAYAQWQQSAEFWLDEIG